MTHVCEPRACTTPRANPEVDCGLWATGRGWCSFSLGVKKCAVLVNDFDDGGGPTMGGVTECVRILCTLLSTVLCSFICSEKKTPFKQKGKWSEL